MDMIKTKEKTSKAYAQNNGRLKWIPYSLTIIIMFSLFNSKSKI